jgi:hypothetical protein
MADLISSANKSILRSPGDWSKLFLAIRKPAVIYRATVKTVLTETDKQARVEYTAVSGTIGNVKTGMCLYVGTSADAYDLGVLRIRKAPDATYIYFGDTSEVDWLVGGTIYLTILDDYDLRMKPPIASGNNILMETDVAYADQHEVFDPVHAGCARSVMADGCDSGRAFRRIRFMGVWRRGHHLSMGSARQFHISR